MADYTLAVDEMGRASASLSVSGIEGAITLADDFQAAFVAQATTITLSDVQHDVAVTGMQDTPAVPTGGRGIASKLTGQRF